MGLRRGPPTTRAAKASRLKRQFESEAGDYQIRLETW
jgi:hypothetical protein